MPTAPDPSPITLRGLLRLYLPLALTFLLMSGSSPIINKGIGHLPDETIGLAAYINVFTICLFLYSPCFAVRDIGLKFIRGKTSYRQVLVFQMAVAGACTLLLLVIALTSLLDGLILERIMRLPAVLTGPVKRGILAFIPMPTLITLRGVHQAVHIHADTAKWVGLGTTGRFVMIIAFVFAVGLPLRIEGALMGGMALALGMATEMVITTVTAVRGTKFIREDPPNRTPPGYRYLMAFAVPLFAANIMGVFLQPLSIAIVNSALLAEPSGAAFGVVKSFVWFFSSTLFAMQAVALARADSLANLRRIAVFTVLPISVFTLLTLMATVSAPIRSAVLETFFEIDSPEVLKFVTATLPWALALPALVALRAIARGLLLRAGKTTWVSISSLAALLGLLGLYAVEPTTNLANGATIGFLCWVGAMAVELVVQAVMVTRIGLSYCVTEGGRS